MARLDQLGGQAKFLLQIGSVIGKEFTLRLLAAISPYDNEETRETMKLLVGSGLIHHQGLEDQISYLFKHSLIQDAAYQSILKTARLHLHRRIVEAIENDDELFLNVSYELLAYHCTEASITDKAIEYRRLAGQRASERSARQEAIHHLNKGLELLMREPESAERNSKELSFLLIRGPVLMATEGPGSTETRQTYQRSMELCETLPESPLHFTAAWGWWRIHMNMSFTEGRKWAYRLLELAKRLDEPGLLLQAHHCQWATLFNIGEQVECLEHIRLGLTLYDSSVHHVHAALYGGHDPQGVRARRECTGIVAIGLSILIGPGNGSQRRCQEQTR